MEIETFYKEHNFIGWTETSAKEGLMVNDSMR
jgi:Ras-related protein Rab-7L1